MIEYYLDEHNVHIAQAKEQNFKPLEFPQFVSLVIQLEELNSRDTWSRFVSAHL